MNEIVRRFEPVARRASRTMTDRHSLHDDLANAARLGLVRAVRRHDSRIPGFASYAARYMTGAARRELGRWIAGLATTNFEADEAGDEPPVSSEEEVLDRLAPWGEGVVADVVEGLTSEQQSILRLRYVDEASLAGIASTSGTSVPAVSQRLATIHRKVELALAA